MNVIVDPRADKELTKFNKNERAKVREYILLFKEYGYKLDARYLKKVRRNIWELRPRSIRLFLIAIKPKTVIIHIMRKKSQKISKRTLQLLEKRMQEYV